MTDYEKFKSAVSAFIDSDGSDEELEELRETLVSIYGEKEAFYKLATWLKGLVK